MTIPKKITSYKVAYFREVEARQKLEELLEVMSRQKDLLFLEKKEQEIATNEIRASISRLISNSETMNVVLSENKELREMVKQLTEDYIRLEDTLLVRQADKVVTLDFPE